MRPVLRKGLRPLLWLLLLWFCWNTSESARAADSPLQMASFNIQIFGQSKMKKAPVVSTLIRILDRYDLVFIMEIRDSDETAIYDLLLRLNQQSPKNFQIIVSERLGRTASKEQYAFIYNSDRVNPDQAYVFADSSDSFEREPYVAHFTSGEDEFSIIGIHTSPSDVKAELHALPQVYVQAKQKFASKNIYVIGDFNADCSYYDADEGFDFFADAVTGMVPESADTTVAKTTCTYDRVLAFGTLPRSSSVALPFNFQVAYGMTVAEAQEVSDHYPVEWTFDSTRSATPTVEVPVSTGTPAVGSCGLNPAWTAGGYCYADLSAGRRRVANSCCPQ